MKRLLLLLSITLLLIGFSAYAAGPGGAISSPYADRFRHILFAALGTPTAGRVYYCDDCNPNTSPCTSGGGGAVAERVGVAWVCHTASVSGSGTVTSVGNGTIGSLFTATWATATTTPALSFDITNQGTVAQVLHGNAAGHPSFGAVVSTDLNVTGTTCSNQFLTVLSSSLAGTCTTVTLAGTQFANQGTTTTLLHGAAAGNPSWSSVVSADLNITTSTCTNQFLTAISATGTGTCTTDTLASAQHANQGTTTTVLHGAAAGNPSFGSVALADMATQATNTIVGNATSGSAAPTALAVGTCSTAGSALNWTTNTGFGCNTSITANTATTATNTTNTAITDDTSTNATMFPTWVTTASGNQAQKVSSTLLTFNPSTGNFGIGGSPSGTTGLRLLVDLDGNQVTKIQSLNNTAGTGAAANVNATSDLSAAQLSAFSSTFSGTLAGINLAGASSVNNAGVGTVGMTVGTTSAAPLILMTNSTRALTVSSSSQAVSLRGTQTNDNATAGDSGEYQTGTVAANTTSLSTGTTVNVGTNTNITLTAGDWDCSGVVNFTFGATTSITNLTGGISTTTGTLPAQDSYFDFETSAIIPTGTAVATWVVPTVRLSNSGSTNVFLVSQATFTASTIKVGGTIRCRRMR